MATARVRQDRCPECSAALTIPPEAQQVRCAYCGSTLAVENRRPPRDPTLTAPRTVYVPPAGARVGAWVGALAGLLPLVFVGVQFWPHLRSVLPVLGNQLPTECPLNGRVTIDGKTFSGTGTLIRAATNCKVVIRNSHLEGDVIVEGGVNVAVEVDRSTLVARKRAIVASVNANVRIGGKSEVRGKQAGLDLGLNAEVVLDDSLVASDQVGLRADGNLVLDGDGGRIEGGKASLEASRARRLELDHIQLVGPRR